MYKKITAILVILSVILLLFFYGYFEEEKVIENLDPVIEIIYPSDEATVSRIVTISGTASDPDGDDKLLKIEVMIDDEWITAEGNTLWSYEWKTFGLENGIYTVYARAWDGNDYSKTVEIKIRVYNPEIVESDANKWAIFIAASNFPKDNESKLGNGALNLAEKMAAFFIENLGYSTSNIFILFDDGWIRENNGYGKPIETLQQREHQYDITYAGAMMGTVTSTLEYVVKESNKFIDSEVFIWIASHGCGDQSRKLFGGKILDRSAIFLWDDIIDDSELGNLLSSLRSDKTCVIVDACYSGGFADKTIFNIPEFFLLKSEVPRSGRIVISGASKFRVGYASTTEGPLFSQIWFHGLTTDEADGFRPFILNIGRPTTLKLFKDGKSSVEEAFYYARYVLRTDKSLRDYSKMEPQINDQYPRSGILGRQKGMILGE
jgi:hypothetical protein